MKLYFWCSPHFKISRFGQSLPHPESRHVTENIFSSCMIATMQDVPFFNHLAMKPVTISYSAIVDKKHTVLSRKLSGLCSQLFLNLSHSYNRLTKNNFECLYLPTWNKVVHSTLFLTHMGAYDHHPTSFYELKLHDREVDIKMFGAQSFPDYDRFLRHYILPSALLVFQPCSQVSKRHSFRVRFLPMIWLQVCFSRL